MKNLIDSARYAALSGLLLLAGLAGGAQAATNTVPLDTLRPTQEHIRATAIILDYMQRYHYRRVPLTDELSTKIYDRFLEALDRQKSYFLASDIDEFEVLRLRLDDALRYAKLNSAFEMFKRFRTRVGERAAYAASLIDEPFDFSKDEEYVFNRQEDDWAKDEQALDDHWRKRVKNDILALRLAGRDEEQIKKTLTKRYERMTRRVNQLRPNDVYQYFINAYTTAVDPHSSYFSPRTSENFKIRMSLSLEGIGAALNTEDEFTVVRRIIAGGPAARSKELHVEDRIVGVGQGSDEEIVDVVSWRLEDVVDLIRGPKDTEVRLRVLPGKAPVGSPTKVISLVRDKINLEEQAARRSTIEIEMGGEKARIGVIDVPTFYLDAAGRVQGLPDYRSTTRDVRRLINELESEGVAGIIIDLRGNSGGSLLEANALTGLFIESGPIVQIRDSSGRIEVTQDSDPGIAYTGPLAVLVDRGSASASEIFAAAIQDYGRGLILGEPTYGKGTVQNVVSLDRKGKLGQLKVTIAQFYRVNGDGTQYRGVIPNIIFPTATDSDAEGERALENALPWGQVSPADYSPWRAEVPSYDELMNRHQSRVADDERFKLLLDELESQRESRKQVALTLREDKRKARFEKREDERDKRETLFRKAFGVDLDDEESRAVPDIVLEEAAHVLGDLINLPSSDQGS